MPAPYTRHTILINGTDYTDYIPTETVQFNGRMRKGRGDELSFVAKQVPGSFPVEGGALVKWYLKGETTPYFVGHILLDEPMRHAPNAWHYPIRAYSAEEYFYRKTITAHIRSQTVESAVNEILQNNQNIWPDDLHTTVINSNNVMDFVLQQYVVNYAMAYQVLDLFAELTNSAWRVNWNETDSRFELEFYDPIDSYQGLVIGQDTQNFRWGTLKPRFNLIDLINRQMVKGGRVASTSQTVAYFRGDDLTSRFDMPTEPFGNEVNIVIYDVFDSVTLNPSEWTEFDVAGDFVYVSSDGALQFEPDLPNSNWVGIYSTKTVERERAPSLRMDMTWVDDGEAAFGFSTSESFDIDADENIVEELMHGVYIDDTGLIHHVNNGTAVTTGISLTEGALCRFYLKILADGGSILLYQDGADLYTRNWDTLGTSASGTGDTLSTVLATADGGYTVTSFQVSYPYQGIKLEVDRGSGFEEEYVGVYPADQDLPAVIRDKSVLAFFGSDPGPSTIPPTPNFQRTVTSIDTGTDVLTASGGHFLSTGDPVVITVDGTIPGGVAPGFQYHMRSASSTTFTLHSTKAGALANTGKVNITSAGSGTITFTPGPDYQNIRVTYSESEKIVIRVQENQSISDLAGYFGGGDDGIRDGAVIVDTSINSFEIAHAHATRELANRSHLIESIQVSSTYYVLDDAGDVIPKPGDTVSFRVTIPTTNYIIEKNYPLDNLSLRYGINGDEIYIDMVTSFFKKGLRTIFEKMKVAGELITISDDYIQQQFVDASESIVMTDTIVDKPPAKITQWGSNLLTRTISGVNGTTETFTTSTAHPFDTGHAVMLYSTGTLPTGVTQYAHYYLNKVSSTEFKLYDTQANAIAGTGTGLVNLTGAGTGTRSVTAATWRWYHHKFQSELP